MRENNINSIAVNQGRRALARVKAAARYLEPLFVMAGVSLLLLYAGGRIDQWVACD